jgi:hypothetical protein
VDRTFNHHNFERREQLLEFMNSLYVWIEAANNRQPEVPPSGGDESLGIGR